MRTAAECEAKADKIDQQAARCGQMQVRFDYYAMATTWRWLARQAAWQDRFGAEREATSD